MGDQEKGLLQDVPEAPKDVQNGVNELVKEFFGPALEALNVVKDSGVPLAEVDIPFEGVKFNAQQLNALVSRVELLARATIYHTSKAAYKEIDQLRIQLVVQQILGLGNPLAQLLGGDIPGFQQGETPEKAEDDRPQPESKLHRLKQRFGDN